MIKTLIAITLLIPMGLWAQSSYSLRVLGTVQDGGSPHIGCSNNCCVALSPEEKDQRKVSCLAVVNKQTGDYYIFDATPDFDSQIRLINETRMPSGIFLTHAHIGHYTGLMYLGREAKGAAKVPVYAMPKMISFLSSDGPWSQLVALENIKLCELQNQQWQSVDQGFSVKPILVPHRDEYSETVGYIINLNSSKVLFIPDIDKWGKWTMDLRELITQVDMAFIDATFYDQNEVNRDMSEIPHPFVVETMDLLNDLKKSDKTKVNFIHLNHSNPLLDNQSNAYKNVNNKGFKVARLNDQYEF